MSLPAFHFDHSLARTLSGAYIDWPSAPAPRPRLVFINQPLATALGLDFSTSSEVELAGLFGGNALPADARPIALAYAGHQFGHFAPQLGDGRALLLGELLDPQGRRHDLAFKGSGHTPFSRGGDGLAALGPMLREVLFSEALHALGIPSSRALAVVATGALVQREQALPGALLTRTAASHLRVGSFEYFAARNDHAMLRRLADYAIARHDPALQDQAQPYLAFLQAVIERQAKLIAQWQGVGFIHGVMNTDNMSIAGETIDYGPCAFMEGYAPQTVYSSIDHHGRYAYGNQPAIAQWNLARLAEALLPLLADEPAQAVELATAAVSNFGARHQQYLHAGLCAKLGLQQPPPHAAQEQDQDAALIADWLQLLQQQAVDFTLAWRQLASAADGDAQPLRALFAGHEAVDKLDKLDAWLARWQARCARADAASGVDQSVAAQQRTQAMRAVNPWLIARNQAVEETLVAASAQGDLSAFERLLHALRHPFEERPAAAAYAQPSSPAFMAGFRTYCGT